MQLSKRTRLSSGSVTALMLIRVRGAHMYHQEAGSDPFGFSYEYFAYRKLRAVNGMESSSISASNPTLNVRFRRGREIGCCPGVTSELNRLLRQ